MERWHAKLLSLLIIFVVTLTATLLPIKVSHYFERQGRRGQVMISCLMCFGGGVFLSVYMLHMAPDVKDILDQVLLKPYNITYPLSEFIMGCGFFLMVFAEHFVHTMRKPSKQKERQDSQLEVTWQKVGNRLSSHTDLRNTRLTLYVEDSKDDVGNGELDAMVIEEKVGNGCVHHSINEKDGQHENKPTFKDTEKALDKPPAQHGGHSRIEDYSLQTTRSVLLLLALSMHHMFEGITIGLQHTKAGVWSLCIAILSHEIVIAFSLGLQLTKAYKRVKKVVLAGTICSLMVPVGLAIGMSIMETGSDDSKTIDILNGVLQGISTGVFIYITFFEILATEMAYGEASSCKLMFMLLGFLLMAALGLIPEEQGNTVPGPCANCNCTGF